MRLRAEVEDLRELIGRYRRGVGLLDDDAGREAAAALDRALRAVEGADLGRLAVEDARLALAHARAVLGRLSN